jgi:hypothetical protein
MLLAKMSCPDASMGAAPAAGADAMSKTPTAATMTNPRKDFMEISFLFAERMQIRGHEPARMGAAAT